LKPDGTPDKKYVRPYGDNRHLYFSPGAGALLEDRSVPVVIVEAEKSARAITSAAQSTGRRVLAIALGGCWNWKGTVGKAPDANGARCSVTGPLSDFDHIMWTDRRAIVLFDARPNDSVQASRRQLGRHLTMRGADVRDAHLPDAAAAPSVSGRIAIRAAPATSAKVASARLAALPIPSTSGNVPTSL
jgi:hypothetical protein